MQIIGNFPHLTSDKYWIKQKIPSFDRIFCFCAPIGLKSTTLSVRDIVALQGCPKRLAFWGADEVRNEWVFAKGGNEWYGATEDGGALRNARCFFLLIAPLHLPQAARCSEPVNSRCGCVWQGRRFGSASKVKKSRKTGVSLALFAKCDCYFNSWSVCVANIKRRLRCHEAFAMLAWSKARFDFHAIWPHFISEATSFFMHRRCA